MTAGTLHGASTTTTGAEHHGTCPAAAARRRRRRAAVVGLGVGGTLLVTSGAFAAWQATTSVSSAAVQAATAGVEIVSANGGTFSTAVPDLLPGDFFYRYVDLNNRGTVASAFAGTVGATGSLGAALQVVAETCSTSWTTTSASCSGTTTTLLTARPLGATGAEVSYGTIAPGATNAAHVRYRFTLPPDAPSTLMGQTSAITSSVSGALVGGSDRTQG